MRHHRVSCACPVLCWRARSTTWCARWRRTSTSGGRATARLGTRSVGRAGAARAHRSVVASEWWRVGWVSGAARSRASYALSVASEWWRVGWASGRCTRASECRRVGVVAGRLGERALRTRARRMRRRVRVVAGRSAFFRSGMACCQNGAKTNFEVRYGVSSLGTAGHSREARNTQHTRAWYY